MSGLNHVELDPALVKLIEQIARMTTERRNREADFGSASGEEIPSEAIPGGGCARHRS
jgi:hypothetical protein